MTGILGLAVAAGALALVATLAGVGPQQPDAAAFDQTWVLHACQNVTQVSSQYRFHDDAPGAGANQESVFISVNANEGTAGESCTWRSDLSLDTSAFQRLQVRAAVNDGAQLVVTANSSASCGGTTLGTVTITAAESNNAFVSETATVTAGTLRSVCVMLDDQPNDHAQRISSLVDRIVIYSSTSGNAVGWEEGFGRAN